jgi:hypothetical protein
MRLFTPNIPAVPSFEKMVQYACSRGDDVRIAMIA